MHKKVIEFNKAQRTKSLPELRAGDTVRIHRKIVEEGKERIQIFEGLILAMKGAQSSSPTITVRKNSFGIGVELIIPLHSPTIEKLELIKRAGVRHSKIYFVRNKSDRELKRKLRDVPLTNKDLEPIDTEVAVDKAPSEKDQKTEVPEKDSQKETDPAQATNEPTTPSEKKNS